MFVGFSKTLAKFGGFRLGLGIRITKKNVLWASLVVLFVSCFQLLWYSVLFFFWLIYAFFYSAYWCIKTISKRIKENTTVKKGDG